MKTFLNKLACTVIYGVMCSGMFIGFMHVLNDYVANMDRIDQTAASEKGGNRE